MRNFAEMFSETSPPISEGSSTSNKKNEEGNVPKATEPALKPKFQPAWTEETLESAGKGALKAIKVNIAKVLPNPFQPRAIFNETSLAELAASIKEKGVIQPILVRAKGDNYELIAGERRLRASQMIGLSDIPAIVKILSDKEMAELAIIENLQREDLHFLEEAKGFSQLIANFGLTQEELAKRIGKSQSTIANKLRILKLSPEALKILLASSLTERHARALLKIENAETQLELLKVIIEQDLNVKQTEDLIETHLEDLAEEQNPTPKQKIVRFVKDVRIFLNTINSVASQMKKSGMDINYKQDFDGDYVTIIMKIKNTAKKM